MTAFHHNVEARNNSTRFLKKESKCVTIQSMHYRWSQPLISAALLLQGGKTPSEGLAAAAAAVRYSSSAAPGKK